MTRRDGDHLLRAVLEEPGDDLPRMAYADWLDEQGQAARAEFIRVQLEMARLDLPWLDYGRMPLEGEAGRLQVRERELARTAVPLIWRAGEGVNECLWSFKPSDYRRGFLSVVRCQPVSAWMGHAEAICRAHPLTEVELSDREPMETWPGVWTWGRIWGRSDEGEADRLPHDLFCALWNPPLDPDEMPYPERDDRYSSRQEARAALSLAAVALGRQRAGLSPLALLALLEAVGAA